MVVIGHYGPFGQYGQMPNMSGSSSHAVRKPIGHSPPALARADDRRSSADWIATLGSPLSWRVARSKPSREVGPPARGTGNPAGDDVGASVHAASRVALGLSVGSPRNPDTSVTRTEVSTTPLGGCFHRFGDNRELRLPAFATIRFDRFGDVCLRHALEISCALLEGSAQFFFPAGSLATVHQAARPQAGSPADAHAAALGAVR